MKIGILTFHRAINYGAVLQCYAMKETLRNMGHEVCLIDYRPWYFETQRKAYVKNEVKGSMLDRMKNQLAALLMSKNRRRTIMQFDKFLNNSFALTKPFHQADDLDISTFDAVVFGSDQIWSPSICHGFDKVYWGNVSHPKVRFLTYAASIGGHNKLTDEDLKQMEHLLQSYNSISVREAALQEMLKNVFKMDVPLVCDPTLLVDTDVFDRIAIKPQEGEYVLFFALQGEDGSLEFAKSISRQLNCQLIWLQTYKGLREVNGVKTVGGVSVEEFLGYFKYARCVVSLSFHAAAFSVIFKKDFYSIDCSQGDRARNLLRELGLEDRMVSSRENITFSEIDYTNVGEIKSAIMKSSRLYLENALR